MQLIPDRRSARPVQVHRGQLLKREAVADVTRSAGEREEWFLMIAMLWLVRVANLDTAVAERMILLHEEFERDGSLAHGTIGLLESLQTRLVHRVTTREGRHDVEGQRLGADTAEDRMPP